MVFRTPFGQGFGRIAARRAIATTTDRDTEGPGGQDQRYDGTDALIEPEELAQKLRDPGLLVLDVRFDLANPGAGEDAYRVGHVPGAFFLDLERDLAGPRGLHGGRHPLPSTERLETVFGRVGLRAGCDVVVYDEDGTFAPHAWWLVRYVGHDRVRVLNGGFPGWRAAGLPVTRDIPAGRSGVFRAKPRREWVVDRERVAHLSERDVLIDARAPERYRGEVEPIDPQAGHIPGAINVFWKDGLEADGRWKGAAAQRERFAFAGETEEILAYCGSGVTACADLFALHLAGRTGKVYHGSFSDWASYDDLPVIADVDHQSGTPRV